MGFTYSAFISYRHLPADLAAAKAIQRALETYRIPGDIRRKTGVHKLKRCFRDQDELPLANDLGESIEKALQESEWLIVVCSPDLPASAWCCREVEYFIEMGRRDRIIPALIAGDPRDSYPPQITRMETENGEEEVEPLATDLRGNLRRQLKTQKMRIVARMLNLDFNDLRKRERERVLRRGLILVSSVLIGVSGFAAYAVYNNHLLTEERNATARNATELLLEKSVRCTEEGELGSGMTYALQAYQGSRIFGEAYDTAVSAALEAAMYPDLFAQLGTLKDQGALHRRARLSRDGKSVACRQADNSLQVYSAATGEKRFTIRDYGWFGNPASDFSPDGQYICQFTENRMTLYDSEKGTVVCTGSPEEGWQIAFDGLTAKNEVPVYQPSDGAAGLYDPIGKKTTVLEGLAFPSGEPEVELHRSGQRAAWSDGDRIWIIDMETPRILLTLEASQGQYTDDDWYFRYVEKGESVYLRWDTLEEVCRSEYAGVLSPDGKWLATANNTESFTLWDASTQEMLWTEGHNSGNTLYSLAFVDDDTLIACHEEVQIYRLSDRSVVYDSGKERTTYGFDFAAGRLVMPLRAGGCQLNLLPDADDTLPHVMTETREGWSEDDFAAATTCFPLAGNWNGMAYYLFNGEDWVTLDTEEPGLLYLFDGKEYILYPVNGIVTSYIYVSPDGKWQALIRNEEVDLFRAEEGPEPVMTIPGNGYSRLCAAFYGDILALGSYVENLVLYDLNTGDCLGTVNTGAMCTKIQFSPDGKHLIAFSAMAERATVANTENLAAIMSIPVRSVYDVQAVGFGPDGTEAAVLYRDGKADVGLLYRDLDTLVEKARKYME